jgi:ABC-type multidrug transport system fused ATPase/permease subunit
LTEIGERGVNLSGGQKARVSLARAIFISIRRANVCLFDDPFSAVDGETGNYIFQNGILKILRNNNNNNNTNSKITIICLNSHLHLLPYFDRIIMLDDGKIVMDGSPNEIVNDNTNAELLANATRIDTIAMKSMLETVSSNAANSAIEVVDVGDGDGDEKSVSVTAASDAAIKEKKDEDNRIIDGKIIVAERREIGAVKWGTYIDYFGAAFWPVKRFTNKDLYSSNISTEVEVEVEVDDDSDGKNEKKKKKKKYIDVTSEIAKQRNSWKSILAGLTITFGLIILFTCAQIARVAIDYTLAKWAEDDGNKDSKWSTSFYASFGILAFFLCIRSFYLNIWSYYSSKAIHQSTFQCIVQAPITTFFDTHTVGEVLNKLSKDTEVMDSMVPEFLLQFFINFYQVTFTFGICIWSSPYVALMFLPLAYLFKKATELFGCVTQDLKRMESISRSPIFSSLSETLAGLDTIRAYGDITRFRYKHQYKMDQNSKYYFHIWMCTSWMTVRLELITAAILVAVALFAVFMREKTDPVILGLALSYGLQLTALFQRCVQLAIDVSVFMTSVERIMEYLTIPQEQSVLKLQDKDIGESSFTDVVTADAGDVELSLIKKSSTNNNNNKAKAKTKTLLDLDNTTNWPTQGDIKFENIFFRYRDNPFVLNDLSFHIHSGERVGICGRTGAGKSSIIFALFRMAEISSGSMYIDNKNITYDVPLCLLRNSIAIIPQSPELLTGTIRYQLDPLNEYSDKEIWDVLDIVNMSITVKNMSNVLNEQVMEGGSNLSHGQRQLVCIARALLRKTKILVVDEGTSAVDPATDELIQIALRNSSNKLGTTVLAIAHRLQTIKDFDRILVMGDGHVLEFDSPYVLLNNRQSHFSLMLGESECEEELEHVHVHQ